MFKLFFFALSLLFYACMNDSATLTENSISKAPDTIKNDTPQVSTVIDTTRLTYSWIDSFSIENTLVNRIPVPQGYMRLPDSSSNMCNWLRHIPLKPGKPNVLLYNGEEKWNQDAHFAVINMDVGTKDLQQCADAVMRLQAEYLYAKNDFDAIHFNFTSGDKISFSKWKSGYRPVVSGNSVHWTACSSCNNAYPSFKKYMNAIFNYAGTLSLSRELQSISLDKILPGDVFIKGGSPGHAVMVMDVAINEEGNKLFLIAQSYMPAQEMHILKNPMNNAISPWYSIKDISGSIYTPEWTFYDNQLMRFR